MSRKRLTTATLHTTFGKSDHHVIGYRCRKCRVEKRIRPFTSKTNSRISPLFSTILTLLGVTWPENVAAACALTAFGQKVSATTVYNLLQKEAPPGKLLRLTNPEHTTACSDGILVNG